MSYLDDLSALFGDNAPDLSEDNGRDGTIPARTALETVRAQLEESSQRVVEHPGGRFTGNGECRGCGYATLEVVVDEEAGTCTFDINTHLRVQPEHAQATRRMLRMINGTLIQTGLTLDDEGIVHFIPEAPLDVRGGDDVAMAIGRGMSTVHSDAWKISSIAAGIPAWELD